MSAPQLTPLQKYSQLVWQCDSLVREASEADCSDAKKALLKQLLELKKADLATLWAAHIAELEAPYKEKEAALVIS